MANGRLDDQNDPDEKSFVRITNRQIYDSLIGLERTVDSMDGRLNAILKENVDLRTRVRALELKTYTIMAGLLTALVGGGMALSKGVF